MRGVVEYAVNALVVRVRKQEIHRPTCSYARKAWFSSQIGWIAAIYRDEHVAEYSVSRRLSAIRKWALHPKTYEDGLESYDPRPFSNARDVAQQELATGSPLTVSESEKVPVGAVTLSVASTVPLVFIWPSSPLQAPGSSAAGSHNPPEFLT